MINSGQYDGGSGFQVGVMTCCLVAFEAKVQPPTGFLVGLHEADVGGAEQSDFAG